MPYTNIHWNFESWGSDYPPENWREICSIANKKIDEYADELAACDPLGIADEELLQEFSEDLWILYTECGEQALAIWNIRREK